MQVYTLGALGIENSNFNNEKALLLLAYLAHQTSTGNWWRTEQVAELIWPSAKNPIHSLTQDVSNLRKQLGFKECIKRKSGNIQINKINTDAQELLAACENKDFLLIQELYKGQFLQGINPDDYEFLYEEWILPEQEKIKAVVWRAYLNEIIEQQVVYRDMLEQAYKLTQVLPLPESSDFKKIFCVIKVGKLENTYLGRLFSKEIADLDVTDLPQTIEEALKVLDWPHDVGVKDSRRNTLKEKPFEASPKNLEKIYEPNNKLLAGEFVGRDEEIKTIKDLLPHKHLVTLWGMGGIGKTRLLNEIYQQFLDEQETYPDGVHLFHLEPVSPEHFVSSFVQRFGLQVSGNANALEELCDYLKNKHTLLLLDNFEHLLNQHDVLTTILSAAPLVSILISSRNRLNIEAEQLYELQGLPYPQSDIKNIEISKTEESEAVSLFLIRRQKVQHDFKLDENNYSDVLQLCQNLWGMPLAIELAAGMRHRSIHELLTGLSELDFFKSTSRSKADRHKSVRAIFDFSWQFLSEFEKQVFAQLAVFEGGFKHEAGVEVVLGFEEVVLELLDKSLLQVNGQAERYQLHPLLKEFSKVKLGTYPKMKELVANRHSQYYLDQLSLMTDASPEKRESAPKVLNEEVANIRVAWLFAIHQEDIQRILVTTHPLERFFDMTARYQEGISLLERAEAQISVTDISQATISNVMG